jgi:ribosome-binding protein aMBF1 (putative translation factor)
LALKRIAARVAQGGRKVPRADVVRRFARGLANRARMRNLSRGLFAGYLRTNVRTLENWEQGRAKPNAQAALLIRLVQRFPDTVSRLAEI